MSLLQKVENMKDQQMIESEINLF